NAEYLDSFELSAELRRGFSPSAALVVPAHGEEAAGRPALDPPVGGGGGQFLSTHPRPGGAPGGRRGGGGGRAIAATNFGSVGPVHMVTLTGGVDGYLQTILSSTGESATDAGLTTASVIPAPNIASSPSLAAALREEPTIQHVLKQACSVDQAVVGVGTPTADATIVQLGYLTTQDVRMLREPGVVGGILGQIYAA